MSEIKFKFQINQLSTAINLNTKNLFNEAYVHPEISAIDTFLQKTKSLNTLISDSQNIPDQLTNLIVLGYVSAVESYFREIIRKLILNDSKSYECCADKIITFGAATSHESEMLPEALLENFQFISKSNIKNCIEKFLGLKGKIPGEVSDTLDEFEKVCHLRHCIVHRFGHLGSHNAIFLGLAEHKKYLEKPILIDFNNLQQIILICNNTVKVFNNYLFQAIISRTTRDNCKIWEWDYRKDRKKFEKIYKLFYSTHSPPTAKPTCKDVYLSFRKTYRMLIRLKK